MKTKAIIFFVAIGLVAGFGTGCKKDRLEPKVVQQQVDVPTPPIVGAKIVTTIIGQVSDESHLPIQDVLVQAYGSTTTTNSNGTFVLKDVEVPEERAYVMISKDGFINGSRAFKPKAQVADYISVMLLSAFPNESFHSSMGITVIRDQG